MIHATKAITLSDIVNSSANTKANNLIERSIRDATEKGHYNCIVWGVFKVDVIDKIEQEGYKVEVSRGDNYKADDFIKISWDHANSPMSRLNTPLKKVLDEKLIDFMEWSIDYNEEDFETIKNFIMFVIATKQS